MKKLREVQVCNMSETASFKPSRVVRLVRILDERMPENLRAPEGSLSIAVMDDEALAKIHADFLNDPSKTDVITFEGGGEEGFAGEICVSAERALEKASEFNNTPDAELCLYIAHGMLHLAGVDDIAPEDALEMRAAEAVAAKIIKEAFRAPVFTFNK